MLFSMSYCQDHGIITRHSSHERFLRGMGYTPEQVQSLCHHRYETVHLEAGHNPVRYAVPCDRYKDSCLQCQEVYMKARAAEAARRAACFAEGVLSHESDGDRLYFVSLPVPFVALRSDKKTAYHNGRIGAWQSLRKLKRKRNAASWHSRCKKLRELGLEPSPRAFQPGFIKREKEKLAHWLREHKEEHYQLYAWRQGWLQSAVKSAGKLIPREVAKSGHRYLHRGGRVSADTTAEPLELARMQPMLLRWCFKQFTKRMHEVCDFKYLAVMERGMQGGFHYHLILHVYSQHETEQLESALRMAWYEVTGNFHFDDSDGGSWFRRVRDAGHVAAYVAKYATKGWFSRRQTSIGLNLKDASRDMKLIEAGFLQGDVASNFSRHRDGFLTYTSPFSEEEVESAGCTDWVGIRISPQAPHHVIGLPVIDLVAVFRASSPVSHPARCEGGICTSPDGEVLETIPDCWWYPAEALRHLTDTAQISKLRRVVTRARFTAVSQLLTAGLAGEDNFASPSESRLTDDETVQAFRLALSAGAFPVAEQFRILHNSLQGLSTAFDSAFSLLAQAASARAMAGMVKVVRGNIEAPASLSRLSKRYLSKLE